MSVSIVFMTITLLYMSKFLGLEKSFPLLIAALLQFVTITLGVIILGPILEIKGLAIAYVLASFVNAIFLVVYSKFFSQT